MNDGIRMADEESRVESSLKYFHAGYNCAQAVVVPFCDLIGLDEETALKLASSFGGGVGRMREICGAVSGMAIIAGLLYGYIDPADDSAKAAHYELIQSLAKRFKDMNGSVICRELLETEDTRPVPDARTPEYYASRPCARLVSDATMIIAELIGRRTMRKSAGEKCCT
jgi:C_GCAxxG_C_C family probable redox protein